MAILAISGHETRGGEVIKTLEMLGGVNTFNLDGNTGQWYVLGEGRTIRWCRWIFEEKGFSLEEFLEKFPYKIGDRVRVPEYESEVCISKMCWDGNEVQYEVVTDEVEWYSAKELNEFNDPNKEETFGECIEKTVNECLFRGDEDTMVKESYNPVTLLPLGSKVMIVPTNEDSEIIEENGKFYLVKKQPKYPKTYEECCDVLGLSYMQLGVVGYACEKLGYLQRLLLYRQAYWKIAGEQMGLGKPWEPKWEIDNVKYSILVVENEIRIGDNEEIQRLLVFPTAEMRDAFYENFKDLIIECKELL